MSYLGYSFQARKIKIVAVLFFLTPPPTHFFLWKFYLTLTANNYPLKTATLKKYHIFGNLWTSAFSWCPLDMIQYLKILSNLRFSFPSFPGFQHRGADFPCKNSEFGRLSIFIDFQMRQHLLNQVCSLSESVSESLLFSKIADNLRIHQ